MSRTIPPLPKYLLFMYPSFLRSKLLHRASCLYPHAYAISSPCVQKRGLQLLPARATRVCDVPRSQIHASQCNPAGNRNPGLKATAIARRQLLHIQHSPNTPAYSLPPSTTTGATATEMVNPRSKDPNTLANTLDFSTVSTALDYDLSFETKSLDGWVTHIIECISSPEEASGAVTSEIWLDSRFVDVQTVLVDEVEVQKGSGWRKEDTCGVYGERLVVSLGRSIGKGEKKEVKIKFRTTEKCTAVGWMSKEQTSGGKEPYMYSQCQAIHCRSLFPCQDTPSVKSTYRSVIRSRLPVVTSGILLPTPPSSPRNEFHFEQKIPIPAYLYAVASGDIVSAPIGPRSSVWTGPNELSACAAELSGDTEKFIEVAENIIYEYPWGRYDVLVLPASFPYGGMENPNMTFATPSIISGDKSNIDVIAHELSHSWSGNLVTNASWEDFWLNEGWTTYLERRIVGALHGEPMFHFSAILGWQSLVDSVNLYGKDHEFTKLVQNLEGQDPDDAFSSVPYEKGFNFLYYLETVVGRKAWDTFIPHYFTTYKYRSLTSLDFKSTLLNFFHPDTYPRLHSEVDWNHWLYTPGLPFPSIPNFDTTLATACYDLADKWISLVPCDGGSTTTTTFVPDPSDLLPLSAPQRSLFLTTLYSTTSPALTPALSQLMAQTYRFHESRNLEILSGYLVIALRARDTGMVEAAEKFVGEVGRMKFVRPVFRELVDVDKERAVRRWRELKAWLHPICWAAVGKDLGQVAD